MRRRFEDKIALITGSSRGIGRALALTPAREGASIVVNYNRNADLAAQTVREIEALGTRGGAWTPTLCAVLRDRRSPDPEFRRLSDELRDDSATVSPMPSPTVCG